MTTPISTLLTSLGKTADEIAENLIAAGVTGTANEPNSCAIARYLEANGYEDVAVVNGTDHGDPTDRFQVEANADDGYIIGGYGPVANFIRAFDAGAYPQLVSGGAE